MSDFYWLLTPGWDWIAVGVYIGVVGWITKWWIERRER